MRLSICRNRSVQAKSLIGQLVQLALRLHESTALREAFHFSVHNTTPLHDSRSIGTPPNCDNMLAKVGAD